MFAGLGGWSYALRLAGWADDRPVWTGSCPCQPFSQAGRGGGVADERHLWPHFFYLIRECRPGRLFGEQVSSPDGLAWFDLVQSDLEGAGYAAAALDICAASVGAPHIRQRLYWMAESTRQQHDRGRIGRTGRRLEYSDGGHSDGLADANQPAGGKGVFGPRQGDGESTWPARERPERFCADGGVADASCGGRGEHRVQQQAVGGGQNAGRSECAGDACAEWVGQSNSARWLARWTASEAAGHRGSAVAASGDGGLGPPADPRPQEKSHRGDDVHGSGGSSAERAGGEPAGRLDGELRPGSTNGFWRDPDWLFCRDGKWRPVSTLPQPLVDGSSESLGRVRPEIIAQVEEKINAATAQSESSRTTAMRDLLDYLATEAKRCWASGGLPGLHEAPFLLAFLRQLQEQGWRIAECLSVPRPQTFAPGLRGLRGNGEPSSAPCEHGLAGQLAGERADLVLVLSSLLARHAREAWDDAYAAHAETGFPLAHGARNRMGRLRAYGNAIVAPLAAEFIKAATR